MASFSENNSRIAKNTLMLYFRMLLTMAVSLYTSRVVLNVLGVEDYGIYNIVGGVVVLFSFINAAMSSATQRFLNFELGKKNLKQYTKVYSASINIHLAIAVVILILAETVGLWFVNTQLNLPDNRMYAVNWTYQFTIITFLIGIVRVPFNASILAHERMSFYAYISIFEVVLKLLIVFIIQWVNYDKLIFYSFLIALVSFIVFILYVIYCLKALFDKYRFFWDIKLYQQLMTFSGWSLFGSMANIGKTQVINILLNIYCGIVVNAAVGITNQVSGALNSFVSSFQLASNPQIVKSYATNEREYLLQLVLRTSKFSYFLLLLLSLPIMFNTEEILKWWLKIVPEYAVEFCQLTIIYLLIESISGPLWMLIQATGEIKKYQIVISGLLLLTVPTSYGLIKLGFEPYMVVWSNIIIGLFSQFVRLFFLKKMIDFPVSIFLKKVLLIIIIVTFLSLPFPVFIKHLVGNELPGVIIVSVASFLSVSCSIFLMGFQKSEREFVKGKLKNIYSRYFQR